MAKRGPHKRSLADRYWAKVRKTKTHWFWTASVDKDGYGQIGSGDGRERKAHQLALEFAEVSRPTPSAFALHKCRERRCVNPNHLYWGDHEQNMLDVRKDGSQVGEKNPSSKLSFQDVKMIRSRRSAGELLRVLAADFNVRESTISRVASGVRRARG